MEWGREGEGVDPPQQHTPLRKFLKVKVSLWSDVDRAGNAPAGIKGDYRARPSLSISVSFLISRFAQAIK